MVRNRVAIFRRWLFKPSEPFIYGQASALTNWEPIYVGRFLLGPVPPNVSYYVPQGSKQFGTIGQHVRSVCALNRSRYEAFLAESGVRVIHAHFGPDAVYALRLVERMSLPIVTTFHGVDVTTSRTSLLLSGKVSWLRYVLWRQHLAHKGDLFLCISDYIRRRVLSLGFPEERTATHYIGVDIANITLNPLRSQYPLVVHVARLVEVKGTAYLIKAFAALSRRFPEARLMIVGDGPLRTQLKESVEQLGIGNCVQFCGFLSHKETLDVIERAWVLCQPSTTDRAGATEGLCISILEAAARGVPTVATLNGGIPEAVVDGATGLLVAEKSADEIAEALGHLISESSTRQKMGEAARSHVEMNFNRARQTAVLEQMYDTLSMERRS